MNSAARVAKNSLLIIFAQGIGYIFQIVFFGFAGRYLGVDGYGEFFYVYSFIMIFEIMSDLGLRICSVRDIARKREDAAVIFGNAVILKVIISFFTLACVAVISRFCISPGLRAAFYIAGFAAVTQCATDVCSWVFRGFEKMEYEALILVINRAVLLVLAIAVVYLDLGLKYFFYAILLSNLVRMAIAFCITARKFVKPVFILDFPLLWSIIIQSVPLGIATLLPVISRRSNIFLIKFFKDSAEVGLFSSAFVLIRSMSVFVSPFIIAAFPVYSMQADRHDNSLDRSCCLSFKLLTIFGIPLVICVWILSDDILSFIYGDKFIAASWIIKILAVSLVFSFYNFLYRHILSAVKKERQELLSVVLCLTVNFILAVILIPLLGHKGAGIALLTAEIAMFAVKHLALSRELSMMPIHEIAAKPAVSGLLMCAVLLFLGDLHVIIACLTGIAVYMLSLLILNTFSADDVNIFKKVFNWRVHV